MTNIYMSPGRAVVLLLLLLFFAKTGSAQITWPQGQLLPAFPAAASNQDLYTLSEQTWVWQAEGPYMSHATGRPETDGWLCQTGIDAPNLFMLYGPYDTSLTAGQYKAEFSMKVDNNTANNDSVVDIDVRDATTGTVLAYQAITRLEFPVASNYTSFFLPFTMPVDHHAIELRVFWRGTSYTKVDYVAAHQDLTAELYLFSSLKGIVNSTRPRIFAYEGDQFAEGPYTWMQSLGLTWTEYTDRWQLLTKYRNEIAGLIVIDSAQPHTANLAVLLAKNKRALIAAPSLLPRLTSAPYNLPILVDLRGQFTSKLQVYQTLYNTYWPHLDHRMLIGLDPQVQRGVLREYAVAMGAPVIWLDARDSAESPLLNKFLSSMPANALMLGWWPDEGSGVTRASNYGIATVASDFCSNLTVHSGMPRTVNVKPAAPKVVLRNKIYVAFILSDGDNLQYVEHLMRKLWSDPGRGSVPMGWTLSPAMLDAMPGALNYYYQSSTVNDNLICGPSGYGYAYPNDFPSASVLNQYVSKTEDYIKRAGFRVLTVWNTITGDIDQNVGESYAQYAPSLLGITSQNTSGTFKIYKNSLPAVPLSCNYCTGEQPMEDAIAGASSGWDGAEPRFVLIQAQPWQGVTPTSFRDVMNSLDTNHIVVRPDQFFQLIRQANGLPADTGCTVVPSFSRDFERSVSLFPNPVNNRLYIAGLDGASRLEIYSVTGQMLLAGTGSSIDVGGLRPGTYFIRVGSGNRSQTYKFIKQ